MSLRHYRAVAIDCDVCEESYIDAVEVRDDLMKKFAARDGWSVTDDGRDLCPACTAMPVETAEESEEPLSA